MSTVRVAIAGVGSCCSSFVQGCWFYKESKASVGLMRPNIGPYGAGSVEVVAAFDVNAVKVNQDLADAIRASVNVMDVADGFPAVTGVIVKPGPLLDGVGKSYAELVPETVNGDWDAVVEELRDSGADVLVNFLPVGSEEASRAYAMAALEAGIGFVNGMPVKVANDDGLRQLFEDAGLPLIGDDVQSQAGATATHRALMEMLSSRGVHVVNTSQTNFGGPSGDFCNMKDESRLVTKRWSKTRAVTDVANQGEGLPADSVMIGPSGIIPWLGDRKRAYITITAEGFAGNNLEFELRYEGGDSPGSAAVIYDAVRWIRLALDQGWGGYQDCASAFLMKAPAFPMSNADAFRRLEELANSAVATS
jgi:myo-inositol-1-phosphate synthase